jgi:O-antigen ligase
MRWLLSATVLFLLATDVLHWDLTYSAGLSAENAVLYLITVFVLLRIVVSRGAAPGPRPMYVAFGVLMAYATLSWIISVVLVDLPGYDAIKSGIVLKNSLFDNFVFFLVFLLGLRTQRDALMVIKAILLGAIFANAMTIADFFGLIDLGYIEQADGRAQGALGEANQYAAFIILFLPPLLAMMVGSRGLQRLFWLGGVLVSVAALLLTASRGALVGVLVAAAAGAYLYRRFLSVGRLTAWLVGGIVAVTVLIVVSQTNTLLAERVLTQTGAIDLNDVSSGRSEIWSNAIAHMLHAPLTLVTGFGWNAYVAFPFRYAPHNHYLALWFNIGLVGLVGGAYVLFHAIGRARRASDIAQPPARGALIGFVLGTIALCVAIFFVDLYSPWRYFWAYAGVAMRLALSVPLPAAAPAVSVAHTRDPHGWVARSPPPKTVNF